MLITRVQRSWPRDIGLSVEQESPVLNFLHVTITIEDVIDSCPVTIVPATLNREYAMGIDKFPIVSKVTPYIEGITHHRKYYFHT